MNRLLMTTVVSISVRGNEFWYNGVELECYKSKERKRGREEERK